MQRSKFTPISLSACFRPKNRTPKKSNSIQARDENYGGRPGEGEHAAYVVREEGGENPGSSL